MRARIRDHIRSNVVGYIALFCFAMGGTAYAVDGPLAGQDTVGSADIINGEVQNKDLGTDAVASGKIADRQVKNADLSIGASSSNTIADGGIQGVDVKDNALTGIQVDESTLGGVPHASTAEDAAMLQGLQPRDFIQGGGVAASGFATVPESEGRSLMHFDLHPVGFPFIVTYWCPQDSNNNGKVEFFNDGPTVQLFADNGSANPSFIGELGHGQTHEELAAASGDYITFQARWPALSPGVATVHVFSHHNPAQDSCYAQAQALVTRGQSGAG